MLKGIDISYWQTSTPLDLAPDFVIVRAGYGTTRDSKFEMHYQNAKAAGKLLGIYWYGQPDPLASDAVQEADAFVNTVQNYIGEALLALDYEAQDNAIWGKGEAIEGRWVDQFVDRVHERTGVWPLVYVQGSSDERVDDLIFNDCGLWLAQWATGVTTFDAAITRGLPALNSKWNTAALWQFTNDLNGRGIDGDLFNGDAAAWHAYANPSESIPEPPAPPEPPIATVNPVETMLAIAAGEVGYAPGGSVSKYGTWFGMQGPWCAMFVSWVFNQAGALATIPGGKFSYCPSVVTAAKNAGRWHTTPQKGDLVLFDWEPNGIANHVGIVTGIIPGGVATIEGNTSSGLSGSQSNGGGVYRRQRTAGILGYVRPDWAKVGGTPPPPTDPLNDGQVGPATISAYQTARGLYVDGIAGFFPVQDMQAWAGSPWNDGMLDGQDRKLIALYWPALANRVRYGTKGSDSVRAIQLKLGTDPDGQLGPNDAKAFQAALRAGKITR